MGQSARGEYGVRTTVDSAVPAEEALKMLMAGNERFAVGAPLAEHATSTMREALANHGQAPHTAIIGCADSRVPVDTVFDAMPGDLFVLRNAGNTCTHAEGSMVGSLEFCCGKLGSKLILVLGHTAVWSHCWCHQDLSCQQGWRCLQECRQCTGGAFGWPVPRGTTGRRGAWCWC